jgi:predicted N-formylglutamate amidohydrolase
MSMKTTLTTAAEYLLDDEPPAVSVLNPKGTAPFLFTCDHASNRIPGRIGDLGISRADLVSHIGWDPGAMEVAAELSRDMDASVIHSGYSRLVLDLNRPQTSLGHIPSSSAGITIPANQNISTYERQARFDAFYRPYHDMIASVINARSEARKPTFLVALHSFTANYPGQVRPWHLGITYRHDRGFGAAIVSHLKAQSGLCIGDNEPYQIDDIDDVTIPLHGEVNSLPNALIEIRQDLLGTRSEIKRMANLLRDAIHAAHQSFAT